MDKKLADEEYFDPFDNYYDPDEEYQDQELEEDESDKITTIPLKREGVFTPNIKQSKGNVFVPTENPFSVKYDNYQQRHRKAYPSPRVLKKRGRGRPVYPKSPGAAEFKAKKQKIKPFVSTLKTKKQRQQENILGNVSQPVSNAFKPQTSTKLQTRINRAKIAGKGAGMFLGKVAKVSRTLIRNKTITGAIGDLMNQHQAAGDRQKRINVGETGVQSNIVPNIMPDPSDVLNSIGNTDPTLGEDTEPVGGQNILTIMNKIHHTLSSSHSLVEKIAFDTGTLVKLAYQDQMRDNTTTLEKLRERLHPGMNKDQAGIISSILGNKKEGGGFKSQAEKGILARVATGAAELGMGAIGATEAIVAATVGKTTHSVANKIAESFGEGGFELIQALRKSDVIEYGWGNKPKVKKWDIIEKLPKNQIQILIDTEEFGGRDLAHLKEILKAPIGNLTPTDKSKYENIPEPGIFDQGGTFGTLGKWIGVGKHENETAKKVKIQEEAATAPISPRQQKLMDQGYSREKAYVMVKREESFKLSIPGMETTPEIEPKSETLKQPEAISPRKKVPIGETRTGKYGEIGSGEQAMTILMEKGWTKEQAAGIAGNLAAESGFKTRILGDNKKAIGIAQWHPKRQKDFEKVFGKPISEATFREQVEFVDWELNHTESAAGKKIRAAKTPEEAAAATELSYERSARAQRGEVQPERISAAKSYAENYKEPSAIDEPTLKPVELKSEKLEEKRFDAGETRLGPVTKPTASLIKPDMNREPLLRELAKTPTIIREAPSEIDSLKKTIKETSANPQIIQQPAAEKSPQVSTPMPNVMKVRNDDPLLLTLQYSNIRTI